MERHTFVVVIRLTKNEAFIHRSLYQAIGAPIVGASLDEELGPFMVANPAIDHDEFLLKKEDSIAAAGLNGLSVVTP